MTNHLLNVFIFLSVQYQKSDLEKKKKKKRRKKKKKKKMLNSFHGSFFISFNFLKIFYIGKSFRVYSQQINQTMKKLTAKRDRSCWNCFYQVVISRTLFYFVFSWNLVEWFSLYLLLYLKICLPCKKSCIYIYIYAAFWLGRQVFTHTNTHTYIYDCIYEYIYV